MISLRKMKIEDQFKSPYKPIDTSREKLQPMPKFNHIPSSVNMRSNSALELLNI